MAELRHPGGGDRPEDAESPAGSDASGHRRLDELYVDDELDIFQEDDGEIPDTLPEHLGEPGVDDSDTPASDARPGGEESVEPPGVATAGDVVYADAVDAIRDRAVRAVCDALEIDHPDAPEALGEAYEVVRGYLAPLVVKNASDMLVDHRADVESKPDRRIMFLGRDAHSLAIATRALDPEFFDRHCSEVVLSRAVADAAVQDLEVHAGMSFPQLQGFRSAASKVDPADVQGARMRLADYLQNNEVPVG